MTLIEYQKKLIEYQTSDAPADVKEKAIRELRKRFDPSEGNDKAMKQIIASRPDIDDIGGNFE